MFCMPRVEVLAVMYLLDPRRASPPRVEEPEGGVMSSVLLRRSPTDRRTLGSLYVVSRKGSAADDGGEAAAAAAVGLFAIFFLIFLNMILIFV